jgi:hypothetical protein
LKYYISKRKGKKILFTGFDDKEARAYVEES